MPLFAIVADDHDDAVPRRDATRARHAALATRMKAEGRFLFGAARIADGHPVGSILIVDFADRAAIDTWLATEPYVTERVWQRWIVNEITPGPAFLNTLAPPHG